MQVDVILDARARAADLAALGELAEQAGIGGVWVSSLNDSRDPYANLALLAQRTATSPAASPARCGTRRRRAAPLC